jgi:hypothetical protein
MIFFFVAIHIGEPHGMMEKWNVGILGMKSGNRSILKKMLNLQFMMMLVRHPFSAFSKYSTPLLRENQYNYIRFDSLNPPFHYPQAPIFQYSIVPSFSASGG